MKTDICGIVLNQLMDYEAERLDGDCTALDLVMAELEDCIPYDLHLALEAAIERRVAEAMQRSFRAGWDARQFSN